MFFSNLSGSGELLWEYASIFSRIYTSSSSQKKEAASDLNVLEQLEMPQMLFAGSREAQMRVKLGWGKWQKNCWLTWSKWMWHKIMNTLLWRPENSRKKIQKYHFYFVRQRVMDSIAARREWASDVNGYCHRKAIYHSFGFPLHYGVFNLSSCSPWSRDSIEVLWAPMEHSEHPKRKKTLLPILDWWTWSRARAQRHR